MGAEALSGVAIFADCSGDELAALDPWLRHRTYVAGDLVIDADDPDRFFVIVTSGDLAVSLPDREEAAIVSGGVEAQIVGELRMLTGEPRTASVRAATAVDAYLGGPEAFAVALGLPGVEERLRSLATTRLAEDVIDTPVTLPTGITIAFRPLRHSDREALGRAVATASIDLLRRRFFTATVPPDPVLDYLAYINYVDHFAWVVHAGDVAMAVARFVRSSTDPTSAEVAFSVLDAFQGQGIASILLGALAAVAERSGISTFTAELLSDNRAMRRVLAKADATFSTPEPGHTAAVLTVGAAASLIDPGVRAALGDSARHLVAGAW